ncbi:DUF6167 family protein [Streptomyces longispororuber]|uniref:DUF6167 family protein n=1 Tax=Streptomyces longispororuber TaxID=68230 RepID=UPI00210ADB84|nr:DUF6167 family protein [Streptomyces longispororuber]MCQ4206809.1 DUF6167 family protein [Streptomyces longispororuber]
MFRRTFWFTAGAAAGVWATTKVNRKLKQLTPESLAAQAANKAVEAGHRLKDFALDIRDNMAEREAQLGDALGLNEPVDPELPAQRRFAVIENAFEAKQPKYLENTQYSIDNRNEDH